MSALPRKRSPNCYVPSSQQAGRRITPGTLTQINAHQCHSSSIIVGQTLALAWPFFNRRSDRYNPSDKLRNIPGAL
jgi:hypothetical protein